MKNILTATNKQKSPLILASSPSYTWIPIVSGMSSGATTIFVGHPFDTVKTIIQTSPPGIKTTSMKCVQSIVRNSGFLGLYRGVKPQFFNSILLGSVMFGVYETTKGELLKRKGFFYNDPIKAGGVSGIFTGFAQSIIITPTEMIKCRQQVAFPKMPSVSQIVQRSICSSGLCSLFTGFSATIARQCIGNIFFFSAYEASKHHLTIEGSTPSALVVAASGGIAGVSFWSFIYPIDVVKSYIQVHAPPEGLLQVFRKLYYKGGISIFYRGFTSTVIRCIPVAGTSLLVYESMYCYLSGNFAANNKQ